MSFVFVASTTIFQTGRHRPSLTFECFAKENFIIIWARNWCVSRGRVSVAGFSSISVFICRSKCSSNYKPD